MFDINFMYRWHGVTEIGNAPRYSVAYYRDQLSLIRPGQVKFISIILVNEFIITMIFILYVCYYILINYH